ncbi:Cytidine and deoxycytidylate deaminase zinc-binding region [uncultured archaeon]|nr:Cytidine and deoxycytidylate deaminase zinc-binding region [uncultured archaeon]
MKMVRPSIDEYYLNIALEAGKRSTCNRRHFGAIIVKDGSMISAGYNGPVRGAPNCIDHSCLKNKYGISAGKGYDCCRAGPCHAEVNAIINAARNNGGTLDSTMYIAGEYADGATQEGLSDSHPCKGCQKEIINAGVKEVIIRKANKGIEKFLVSDWVKEAWNTEDKDIKGFY